MPEHPTPVSESVARLYDAAPEREWARMERHRTEFAVTLRALAEHLPPAPARVLDCGGGPGRYAIELARWGYDVTLFDLSSGNLALARQKVAEAGVALTFEQGTALDLGRFADDTFDAVLLMGPLYHLLEADERQLALAEAARVLKPSGLLFAALITRYAAHRDCAGRRPAELLEEADIYAEILRSGRLPPAAGDRPSFFAYFAHPDEASPLMWGAGLEVRTILGVEGLVSTVEDFGVNALAGPAWDAWAEVNYRVAADPALFGGVEHLLVIAAKPAWRRVLRQIAARLAEAGVSYTVVGGGSPALHGLPLVVRDLDIETDAAGAYRFGELFAGQVVEPVALRESATYRSHFGRFDFDGVPVEVMGDLERREGDRWVATAATTQATIDLDGAPVHVSTLEEETLAYIRRGRLDRAALCLPRCDHGRLLALLRGERTTRVL
ncbi:MAG: methyltransferase domain-containing protein [Chloroflexi bacterium]|nr:methyltransferase domain-containing protein [Chloroflexota bacterium]